MQFRLGRTWKAAKDQLGAKSKHVLQSLLKKKKKQKHDSYPKTYSVNYSNDTTLFAVNNPKTISFLYVISKNTKPISPTKSHLAPIPQRHDGDLKFSSKFSFTKTKPGVLLIAGPLFDFFALKSFPTLLR